MSGLQIIMLAGGAHLQIAGGSLSDVDGATATVSVQLQSDGDLVHSEGGDSSTGAWVVPKSAAPGSYQVKFEKVSGDDITGVTMDTWLDLTTTRTATLSQSGVGSKDSVIKVSLGLNSTAIVSANYTLSVAVV